MNYLIQTLYYLNNIETGIPVTELLFLQREFHPCNRIERLIELLDGLPVYIPHTIYYLAFVGPPCNADLPFVLFCHSSYYTYLLWNRYFATKLNTPITLANVVVSKVIRTDSFRCRTPSPQRNTMARAAAIYTHINPNMQ